MMNQKVDTNGWHTVAAISYTDVNAAIRAQRSHPQNFSVTASDQSVSASGTFGDWSLALGGAGPDINMQIEVTGGSIVGPFGPRGAQATLPIAACSAPVLLRAIYVPHIPGAAIDDLVLDNAVPVTVGTPSPQPTTSFLANAAVQELLQQWFTANIADFDAVFASVDLDATYVKDGMNWLRPSYKGYAVAERTSNPTMDNSIFGVLTLIDDAPAPTDLSYAVDAFAIPDGARAAFLISPDKFLQHMLLAALPAMFKDIQNDPPLNHFVIDNDGTRIRNTNGVTCQSVKLENGNTVEPTIAAANFTIQLDTSEIEIAITDMQFEYSAGVTVHLNYSGRSTLNYDSTKGILDLAVTVQSGNGSVTVSEGLRIAEYILGAVGIASSLLMGVGGYVSKAATAAIDGAASAAIDAGEAVGQEAAQAEQVTVTALRGLISGTPGEVGAIAARALAISKVGLIGGFVSGLMPGITEIIKAVADQKYDSLPKITDLTSAAVGETVIWPAAVGSFELSTAQLAGCLQFGLVKSN